MTRKKSDSITGLSRATIRDVAEAAGLSITTASHVLNNRRVLPEKTRRAIFDAVEKVGYRANPSARSLRTGVTNIVSLTFRPRNAVHGSLTGTEYHLRLAGAAAAAAIDRGLGLLQVPIQMLLDGVLPTDGCIVVAPFGNDAVLDQTLKLGMPVVTADPDPDRLDLRCWAGRDEAPGTRELLEHLFDSGSRRIALVTGQDDNSWTRGSRGAYVEWTREKRMKRRLLTLAEVAGFEGGRDMGKRLLRLKDRPDAIIGATSPIAAGIATAARDAGFGIPSDVKIAALSDAEAARSFDPPITALDLQPEAIGRACVDLLCEVMAGNKPVPFITRSVLKRRASTS
jgi:DNA-binding LacI/PurR family transcriptional regulator